MSQVAGLNGSIWPEPEDILLLRFLLHLDSEEALAAWRLWRPGWQPDNPTPEQYRLFPLMAERVAALVPDEPKLGMLQGVRRQSTIRTLLLLDHLEDVLATLDQAGIDGVVLKGPALVMSVYDHVGQRPFHDLDILVDPRRHAHALSALREQGWNQRTADILGQHHVGMERAGVLLDLHRKHSLELVQTGRPTSAWDNIETVTGRRPLRSGRSIRILGPADALLHTIAHGTAAEPTVPLRWVADAQRLLVSGDLDWKRVARLAELFEVAPTVHDSLVFLGGITGISPPTDVLDRLRAVRIARFSRRRMAAFHKLPNREGWLGSLPLTTKLQFTLDQPWLKVMAAAPGYFIGRLWDGVRGRESSHDLARRPRWRRG